MIGASPFGGRGGEASSQGAKWDKNIRGFVIWEQIGGRPEGLCCSCLISPFQDLADSWPLTSALSLERGHP